MKIISFMVEMVEITDCPKSAWHIFSATKIYVNILKYFNI